MNLCLEMLQLILLIHKNSFKVLVEDLIEILKSCNPKAKVCVLGDGFTTEAGTWLEGDEEEVTIVEPCEQFRLQAKQIVIKR